MRDMFADNGKRFEEMHIQLDSMLFDYSKNRIDKNVMDHLIALANEMQLKEWIEYMFTVCQLMLPKIALYYTQHSAIFPMNRYLLMEKRNA